MSKSYSKVMSLETEKEKGVKQSSIPVLDGSTRNFPDRAFQWKIVAYAQGVSAWLGEVVKQAFQDPAKAKVKYPYDIHKAMEIEDKELPDEPDSEDNPTDESETESEAESSSQQQRVRPATVKKDGKVSDPKPANWARLTEMSRKRSGRRRERRS